MSSSHSLCGLPLLFVSSILPNISCSFIFLLLCICICAQTVLVFCLSVSARYSPLAVFDHIDRCSLLSVSILILVFSCNIFSQKPLFFVQFPSSPPIPHIHIVVYYYNYGRERAIKSESRGLIGSLRQYSATVFVER